MWLEVSLFSSGKVGWKNTGWSKTLDNVDINTCYTHTLIVPMKELTNGVRYEQLRLEITNASAPGNNRSYFEINENTNRQKLELYGGFTFLEQPQSLTVEEGEEAVFTCLATGNNVPYSYQWQVRYPDGEYRTIPGAQSPVLHIPKTSLADSGKVYWCVVSDRNGYSIMSEQATSTVNPQVPKTGDSVNPYLLATVAVGCLTLFIVLSRKRKVCD